MKWICLFTTISMLVLVMHSKVRKSHSALRVHFQTKREKKIVIIMEERKKAATQRY